MTDAELEVIEAAEWYEEAASEDEKQATFGREHGLPVANIEKAARRARLAARALRVKEMLVEALEAADQELDGTTSAGLVVRAALAEARKP